jgi:hypothetical protein
MRNFKKTRKRGGAGVIFHCLPKRTANKTCINDFAAANGFRFTDVAPDGNCFFHTLHLYFKNRQDPVALADKNYYKELRTVIIDYLDAHIGDYNIFGLTSADVNALRDNGAWDETAGDYVVPSAAAALGLMINLYDLQDPVPGRAERLASGVGRNAISYMPAVPRTPKHIVYHTYPEVPPAGWVQRGVIHIMRMGDSHFGLLEPLAPAPVAAPLAARAPSPPKAVARHKPKVAPVVSPPAFARDPSPPKPRLTARQQAAANAKMAKAALAARTPSPPKSAQRVSRRKPKVAPQSNNNQFARNLQAALEASARNEAEKGRKKQEKNNAELARAMALSLGMAPSNKFALNASVFD